MARGSGTARNAAPSRKVWVFLAVLALLFSRGIQVARAEGFTLLQLDGSFVKWGPSQFGAGAVVTYAILRTDRTDPDAINCKAMTSIDPLLDRARLDRKRFDERLLSALAMWHAAANITFVPAASAATANIVIGAQTVPRGIAYTNIQQHPVPGSKFASLGQATICLNPMVAWRAGGKRDGRRESYELRRVLAHELGHAIGLDHPGPRGELMAFSYQDNLDELKAGDIAGIVTLYGRPQVPATRQHLPSFPSR